MTKDRRRLVGELLLMPALLVIIAYTAVRLSLAFWDLIRNPASGVL